MSVTYNTVGICRVLLAMFADNRTREVRRLRADLSKLDANDTAPTQILLRVRDCLTKPQEDTRVAPKGNHAER